MTEENNEKIKLEKNVAAVLEVRALVQRCLQLERDIQQEIKRGDALQKSVDEMQQARPELEELAQIGRDALDARKQELLILLRSIVHSTGETDRLKKMEKLLAEPNGKPSEISRWHEVIFQEFCSLYPTRPLSRMSCLEQGLLPQPDWSTYRIKP